MKKYERPENLRSFVVLWIRDAMTASASALTASSVLSGILLFLGLSEKNVGVYLAIIPVANLVLSLLFSSAASATKHTVGAYSMLCLCCSALTAAFLLVFRIPTSSAAFFPVLLCVGAVLSAVAAIRMIFDYQIPCRVMDLKFYSLYISVGGIVSGIAGIATSSLFAFCIKKLEFMAVSRSAYVIAALLLAGASAVNLLLKTLPDTENAKKEDKKEKVGIAELWADASFRALIVPNLLRGFAAGAMSMITVLAVSELGMPESDGAVITACTQAATFASCAVYGALTPKLKAERMGILGAVLFVLIAPSLLFGRISFFVLYTAAYIGYNVVCNALPDMIYQNVSKRIMSPFHTWRLALTTLGTTLSTALIGVMIKSVSPTVILVFGAVTYFATAFIYYLHFTRKKRREGR